MRCSADGNRRSRGAAGAIEGARSGAVRASGRGAGGASALSPVRPSQTAYDLAAGMGEGGGEGAPPDTPKQRFCHAAAVHKGTMYVFGGYDGQNRLNDLIMYRFAARNRDGIPPSSLLADLGQLVNNETLSDITFLVEGEPVHAHRALCMRCTFFRAMLLGEMLEARQREVVIEDMKRGTFLQLMQYLYTDNVDVPLEETMDLLQAADRFGVERLKRICEHVMLSSINIENASSIMVVADLHNAQGLREKCLDFLVDHFDDVSKTASFEEMLRANCSLVMEVLQRR